MEVRPRILAERKEIIVPCGNEELIFTHPSEGFRKGSWCEADGITTFKRKGNSNNCKEIGKGILHRNLIIPSPNQLEEMLKDGEEIGFGGVRVSKDKRVSFAPKDSYKLTFHTPETLATDGGIIAEYGIKGAEILAETSSSPYFKSGPFVAGIIVKEKMGFGSKTKENVVVVETVSLLNHSILHLGSRLCIDQFSTDYPRAHAYGLKKYN